MAEVMRIKSMIRDVKASEYKFQCLFPKIKRTKDIKLMLSSLNRLHISNIFFKKKHQESIQITNIAGIWYLWETT